MSWWKSIISQWQTLPFPHSNLRPEYKQLKHSCQKSGMSKATLPPLRLKLGLYFYSPESPIKKFTSLSPFQVRSHSFHQKGVLMSLKPDTLWLWSHLSPQANQHQTWSELDRKAIGSSDCCHGSFPELCLSLYAIGTSAGIFPKTFILYLLATVTIWHF